MEVLFVVFVAALIATPLMLRSKPLPPSILETWRLVAQRIGIRDCTPPNKAGKLDGEIDGLSIIVETRRTSEREPRSKRDVLRTQIVVHGRGIPRSVVIAREHVFSALGKVFAGADIETGDKEFDEAILLRGDEEVVIALLDDEMRRDVLAAVGVVGVSVSEGKIFFEADDLFGDLRRLELVLRQMIALAQSMKTIGESPLRQLIENARKDPHPAVRLRNLELALRHSATADEVIAMAKGALLDPDPQVRLKAAISVGEDGFEALARLAKNGAIDERIRVKAIEHLWRRDPRSDGLLIELLDRGVESVRAAAAIGLGRRRHAPALGKLIELMKGARVDDLLVLVEAVRYIGDPASEEPLLRLLDHNALEVRIAVIKALGSIATTSAVPAISATADGLLTDSSLKAAAKTAIDLIQKRAIKRHGEADGALALAEPSLAGGAVSITEHGTLSVASLDGELSITLDEDGVESKGQAS
jgi:HEAT repeat protein